MSTTTQSVEQLAAIHIKIRDAIREKEAAHKLEIEPLVAQKQAIDDALLEICREQGANGMRTDAGTVSRRVTTRYWSSDWEHFYSFMKEHDAPYLLEQRIHNGNMKKYLEENPEDMPIGLQANTKYAISVRKPTAK